MVKQALYRVGVYWHVFPTKTDGKDAIWKDPQMLFRIIPKELIERQNEVEQTIYLKNGSVIIVKGADDPEQTMRGSGPVGIVFDEFATMKKEAWLIAEPILRANDGWAWFVGTPAGKNHLYEYYLKGQKQDREWKSWILKASESGIIRADQLEETRKNNPEAHFKQEYECEFLEGEGSVFRNLSEVMIAVPNGPESGRYYSMGVDLAKTQDYTVISVFDRSNNSQVYRDRFKNMDWRYVKTKIFSVAKHYNDALVTIDSTGVGDPIYEDLAHAKVNVVSFKFTETSKEDLINKLAIWIEQRRVKLINQTEALEEYENYSYELGPTGKTKYGAREGFHDDIVTADALAVWDLQPIYRDETEKPKTRIQQFYEEKVKDYAGEGDYSRYENEWNQDLV